MFDIVHLLTADPEPPPVLDSMVNLYIEKRKSDLEYVIWYSHACSPSEAPLLVSAYDSLPEHSRFRFLLSPATYEAISDFKRHRHVVERTHQLLAYLNDEVSLVNGEPPQGHRPGVSEIWSTIGDERLLNAAGGWQRGKNFLLDSLIVVDFDSPFALAVHTSPLMSRPPEDISGEEREDILAKLQKALEYVDKVTPVFGRLVRNYTRAIRIRKCDAFLDLQSEHVTNTIGEIRLMNVHRRNYSVSKLAESLVHESVHNLLSTYEYLYSPFVLTHDDKQYRPVSPWSGNPIPIASFCHAVFVWFALYHLAVKELDQSFIAPENLHDIQRRRNKYASGFIAPTRMSDYLREMALYTRGYLPMIDRLQEIVRRRATVMETLPMMEDTALAV